MDFGLSGVGMMEQARSMLRYLGLTILMLSALCAPAAQWTSLGPDGGDARSLAFDPSNPDRIYLGTSAGELFVSADAGKTWARLAHLGSGQDYVLDDVVVDPSNPSVVYVAAWSVETKGGDVFKSTDSGKTWKTLTGISGKSIRAMSLAPSDPKVIAVGALDGVYRSKDAGDTWVKITSAQAELKNFESIAFDPHNADVIYAGTWHLPWKTSDGGNTWQNIKQGIIEDSDVFSIIVDQVNSSVVFASACSGIYKSEDGGGNFKKVQGIPFSARRTRVLQEDPTNSLIVYAGTTEGLWKTQDAGTTWKLASPASYIVNDVLVDPRSPQRVLIATDRNGVMSSQDGGLSFIASNRGFSHRQVTSMAVDRKNADVMYVSLINNREFGGVFVTRDAATTWSKFDTGLGTQDIFSLDQTDGGTLVAGTARGLFSFSTGANSWKPMNTVLTEKIITVPVRHPKKGKPKTTTRHEWVKSEITGRVYAVDIKSDHWYAATAGGLFRSIDNGKSWTGGPRLGYPQFIAVDSLSETVLAATPSQVLISDNTGDTWSELKLPPFVSRIFNVALGPNHEVWIMTHMGCFHSKDAGATWDHVMVGQPLTNVSRITYDQQRSRILAVAGARDQIYESNDNGKTWTLAAKSHWPIRNLAVVAGKMYAVTDFSGVIMQTSDVPASAAGGGR